MSLLAFYNFRNRRARSAPHTDQTKDDLKLPLQGYDEPYLEATLWHKRCSSNRQTTGAKKFEFRGRA